MEIALGLAAEHRGYVEARDLGNEWVEVEFWQPVLGYLAYERGAGPIPEHFVSARRERLFKPTQEQLRHLAGAWVQLQTNA